MKKLLLFFATVFILIGAAPVIESHIDPNEFPNWEINANRPPKQVDENLVIYYIKNPDLKSKIPGSMICVDTRTGDLKEFMYWYESELYIYMEGEPKKFYRYTGKLWFDVNECKKCHENR